WFFSILKERGFVPEHIVDVGANRGCWTRTALKYFPDAYYTLVEPQDHLKTHVQDLLGMNGKIRWIGAGAGASWQCLSSISRLSNGASVASRSSWNVATFLI